MAAVSAHPTNSIAKLSTNYHNCSSPLLRPPLLLFLLLLPSTVQIVTITFNAVAAGATAEMRLFRHECSQGTFSAGGRIQTITAQTARRAWPIQQYCAAADGRPGSEGIGIVLVVGSAIEDHMPHIVGTGGVEV